MYSKNIFCDNSAQRCQTFAVRRPRTAFSQHVQQLIFIQPPFITIKIIQPLTIKISVLGSLLFPLPPTMRIIVTPPL